MYPACFNGSRTTEDHDNFYEELKKVFNVMHFGNAYRVELVDYKLKNVVRTWFDQWKKGRGENAPHVIGLVLRRLCCGVSFLGNGKRLSNGIPYTNNIL